MTATLRGPEPNALLKTILLLAARFMHLFSESIPVPLSGAAWSRLRNVAGSHNMRFWIRVPVWSGTEGCKARDSFAGMLRGWTPRRDCRARQVVLRELSNWKDGGVVGVESALVYVPKRVREKGELSRTEVLMGVA